jgi:glutathione S-transferase
MIFYDAPVSGNTYKVRLLLRQLAIPHQVVRIDLLKGEARTDEFRRINPFGRVPFIVDGDFSLGESNAILLHLARGSRLLPDDARLQALIQQWMFFEQNQLELAIGIPLIQQKIGGPQSTIDYYRPRAISGLKVLERHLATRTFLVGESYSVADISLFAYTHRAPQAGHSLEEQPSVREWIARVRGQRDFIEFE